MTTLGWIALGVVSGFALIFLLLLIRLFIVDKGVLEDTDRWLRDARSQRDRLNVERDKLLDELEGRDEAIERYVKNEADLLIANEKLRGQVQELQQRIKALEDEKTRILHDEGYISVASVDAEKLLKTISALTAENTEQHEQLAEHKRTITQQQQIIDDLRKQPPSQADTPARRTEGAKVGWEIRKAKQAQKGETQ